MVPYEQIRDIAARSKGTQSTAVCKVRAFAHPCFGCSTVCCEPAYRRVPPAASSVIRAW